MQKHVPNTAMIAPRACIMVEVCAGPAHKSGQSAARSLRCQGDRPSPPFAGLHSPAGLFWPWRDNFFCCFCSELAVSLINFTDGALNQPVSCPLSYAYLLIYISGFLLLFSPSIVSSSIVFCIVLCLLIWPTYFVFLLFISVRSSRYKLWAVLKPVHLFFSFCLICNSVFYRTTCLLH